MQGTRATQHLWAQHRAPAWARVVSASTICAQTLPVVVSPALSQVVQLETEQVGEAPGSPSVRHPTLQATLRSSRELRTLKARQPSDWRSPANWALPQLTGGRRQAGQRVLEAWPITGATVVAARRPATQLEIALQDGSEWVVSINTHLVDAQKRVMECTATVTSQAGGTPAAPPRSKAATGSAVCLFNQL